MDIRSIESLCLKKFKISWNCCMTKRYGVMIIALANGTFCYSRKMI
jgi:hypothetical protein